MKDRNSISYKIFEEFEKRGFKYLIGLARNLKEYYVIPERWDYIMENGIVCKKYVFNDRAVYLYLIPEKFSSDYNKTFGLLKTKGFIREDLGIVANIKEI